MKTRLSMVVVPLILFCLNGLAQNGAAPVVVTNTTANPVPTTITGTPNVTVANIPNIPIETAAFSTVDVAARNIVRLSVFLAPDTGTARAKFLNSGESYTVPEGKRLVIDCATFLFTGPNGVKPFPFLEPAVGFRVFLEPHQLPSINLRDQYVASLPAPLYVDQGQSVSLTIIPTSETLLADAQGFLQGHLVDCGAGCTQQQPVPTD